MENTNDVNAACVEPSETETNSAGDISKTESMGILPIITKTFGDPASEEDGTKLWIQKEEKARCKVNLSDHRVHINIVYSVANTHPEITARGLIREVNAYLASVRS